jgi:hypothetical protein
MRDAEALALGLYMAPVVAGRGASQDRRAAQTVDRDADGYGHGASWAMVIAVDGMLVGCGGAREPSTVAAFCS